MVGTDFSEGAEGALDAAVFMAVSHGASITLVHAVDPPPDFGFSCASDPPTSLEGRATSAAEAELAVVAACVAARGVAVDPVIRSGAPWERIHNVAIDVGADLIVVGASGRRAVPHLLGSVVERLLRIATRPVLVTCPTRLDGSAE